jgi:hypothetical protein
MSRMTLRVTMLALAIGAGIGGGLIVGCDQKKDQTVSAPSQPPEALPAGLMVANAPEHPSDIAEVRKAAADGADVVIHGRVGGSERPFVEGRAAFQLVDLALPTCDKTGPMHDCKTPWDYCCDDKSDVAARSVTVQVVGASGQPLRASLAGVGGLKPMSEVSVKGTVRKSPDGKAMTVNATELYVKQG